jgi:hypothetical protein
VDAPGIECLLEQRNRPLDFPGHTTNRREVISFDPHLREARDASIWRSASAKSARSL